MLVVLFFMLSMTIEVLCQMPVPKHPAGFIYNSGEADAPIQLDVYMGPLCPNSQKAFPTIIKVATLYGPRTLRLRTHLFPLPYHRNAFTVAMGQHIVDKMTRHNMTYAWMQEIYNNLSMFSNNATADMSEWDIRIQLAKIASKLAVSEYGFLELITHEDIDQETRIGWDYACTRRVAGTPSFMVNDVFVAAEPTWTVDNWKTVIDPLINVNKKSINNDKKDKQRNQEAYLVAKQLGTKKYECLQGKIECCTPGGNCIPNVGYRC